MLPELGGGEHLSVSIEFAHSAQQMLLKEGVFISSRLEGPHWSAWVPCILAAETPGSAKIRVPEEAAWRTRAHLTPGMRHLSTFSTAGHMSCVRAPAPTGIYQSPAGLGMLRDLEHDSADGVPVEFMHPRGRA